MTLQFVREKQYSLTIKGTSQMRGLFLTASAECCAPLDPLTGMTVDLPSLEKALEEVFGDETHDTFDLEAEVRRGFLALQSKLKTLTGLTLSEARGWGATFKNSQVLFHKKEDVEIAGKLYALKVESFSQSLLEMTFDLSSRQDEDITRWMQKHSLRRVELEEYGSQFSIIWDSGTEAGS